MAAFGFPAAGLAVAALYAGRKLYGWWASGEEVKLSVQATPGKGAVIRVSRKMVARDTTAPSHHAKFVNEIKQFNRQHRLREVAADERPHDFRTPLVRAWMDRVRVIEN